MNEGLKKKDMEKNKFNYEKGNKIPKHIIEMKQKVEKDLYNYEGKGSKVPKILLKVEKKINQS